MAADATLLLHKDSISSARIHTLSRRVSPIMDQSCFYLWFERIVEANDYIRVNLGNLSTATVQRQGPLRRACVCVCVYDATLKTDKPILKQDKHNTSSPGETR